MQFNPITSVDYLVVHCAATPPTLDIGAAEIDQWHRKEGWLKIGYHYVIRRNGQIEKGRADTEIGAHCLGYNRNSLGICMVGGVDAKNRAENNFTPEQFNTLRELLGKLFVEYPSAQLRGHRELNPGRDCPSFDVRDWYSNTGEPE
jgi:N-acetyl-anhydromuramyl-L-alanine amidase AmpD